MTQAPVAPAGGRFATAARVHRVEDARLLTGTGTYVDDVVLPGMLHACFVRSPVARGRILAIDTVGGARGSRCAPRARRRRREPRHEGAVAHRGRWPRRARDSAATVGRGRSALRRRLRRGRRRRRPLHRRGRRRSRRRGVRAASCARRLHGGRADRRARAPEPRVERLRRDQRPARVGARGRVRVGGPRHVGNDLPAGVHRGPDGDPWPRRRLSTRERRAHDLRGDAVPPRDALVLARACSACPSTTSAW